MIKFQICYYDSIGAIIYITNQTQCCSFWVHEVCSRVPTMLMEIATQKPELLDSSTRQPTARISLLFSNCRASSWQEGWKTYRGHTARRWTDDVVKVAVVRWVRPAQKRLLWRSLVWFISSSGRLTAKKMMMIIKQFICFCYRSPRDTPPTNGSMLINIFSIPSLHNVNLLITFHIIHFIL